MAMTLQSGLSSTGTTRGSALFFLLGRRLGATKDRSATTLGGKSSATSDHRRRRPMTSVVASAFSVASSIVSASPRRAGIVIFDGRRHFHESAKTMLTSSSSYRRTTPRNGRRGGGTGGNNKGLFTPSPFARSSRIIVNDEFAVFRDLMEGNDEIYGMRRYLLLRRSYDADGGGASPPGGHDDVVASLHANKNVLFGSRLHHRPDFSDDIDYYDHRSRYLDACGTLLDVAKEDASINGQQVQALASLDGLCAWVSECLDSDDGGGSDIIAALMTIREDAGGRGGYETGGKTRRTPTSGSGGGGRANQHIITPPPPSSSTAMMMASLGIKDEYQRKKMLDAVRSIATGRPRPGHTVVGAGTYRDGMGGWMALAREYARLATTTSSTTYDAHVTIDSADLEAPRPLTLAARKRFAHGPEEVALYASRSGEVTTIEHLAHTTPEYLKEAGGAMARIFFV